MSVDWSSKLCQMGLSSSLDNLVRGNPPTPPQRSTEPKNYRYMIKEIEHLNTADYSFRYEFELDELEDLKEVIDKINKRHSPNFRTIESPKIKVFCHVIDTSILEYNIEINSKNNDRG